MAEEVINVIAYGNSGADSKGAQANAGLADEPQGRVGRPPLRKN